MARASRWILALGLSLGLCGCGARTFLEEGEAVSADTDAGRARVDAGGRDAGQPPRRDAGPPPMPDAGPPGDACSRDLDCEGGTVCRAPLAFVASDLTPHPLECLVESGGALVGEGCVSSAGCARGLCATPGICVMPCATDADCGDNERCRNVYVQTDDDAMQPLDACTAFFVAPPGVRAEGPSPSVSTDPAFVTPDMLASPTPNALILWLSRPATIPFVVSVTANTSPPSRIFDSQVAMGPMEPAPVWGIGAATVGGDLIAVMYPNGVMTPNPPGGFGFELSSFAATPLQRMIVRRDAPGAVFDVEVYLVGGGGLTTRAGEVPGVITRGVEVARGLLRQVGLEIGEVRAHNVVGQLRARLGVLEDRDSPLGFPTELPELWSLTAGANRPAVHVFYVRTIQDALGIAAGIPGAQVLPGSPSSGVAIAGDSLMPGMLGAVLTHEVGHYMGLFHTSELEGRVGDPHPDTPECRIDRDRNGDGFLVPGECGGAGAENLMFWAGSGRTLTPQQGEVMRQAYFVR